MFILYYLNYKYINNYINKILNWKKKKKKKKKKQKYINIKYIIYT